MHDFINLICVALQVTQQQFVDVLCTSLELGVPSPPRIQELEVAVRDVLEFPCR